MVGKTEGLIPSAPPPPPPPPPPTTSQLTLHIRSEENNLDPDDGTCWSCGACKLPIFSTPFKHDDATKHYLHDQCAKLPRELKDSVLHPGRPLFLQDTKNQETRSCAKCKAICGTMFYSCPDPGCGFQLDVLCALTTSIKILHRSHEHRLIAIRGGGGGDLTSCLTCGACGAPHQHDEGPKDKVSYFCSVCSFWIHPDCATLPSVIPQQYSNGHHHPLILKYGHPNTHHCAICEHLIQSFGAYTCIQCDHYVHIMCVVSDPQMLKSVLTREAQLPDVVGLPIPDEQTSVVGYLTDNTSGGSSSDPPDDDGRLLQLHEHPLDLHDHDDDDDDGRPVCNACAQLIISTPFFRCSRCPDFFLHNHCAHLPPVLPQHPAHKQHTLKLCPRDAGKSFLSTHWCDCCWKDCNGFSYRCEPCDFDVDLLCAFMPASITHHAHPNNHILYSSPTTRYRYSRYNCCNNSFGKDLRYECGTCRNFLIHASCALLPETVRHRFDQHALKLITTPSNYKYPSEGQQLELFCEICENHIDNTKWYYSCDKCEQSFHIGCIPCLDSLSRMKFGVASTHVQGHECNLTLVRGVTVRGYRCGYCRKKFTSWDKLALECSKCCFKIHSYCAARRMLRS